MEKSRKSFFLLILLMILIPIINVKADETDFSSIASTDALIKGSNYEISYEDNKIILSDNANVELKGDAKNFRIIVNENAKVTITLNNYKASSPEDSWNISPFELQTGSNVNLTLIENNTLIAGREASAIRVPENTSLEINGDGTLHAEINNHWVGCNGAVIGSAYNSAFGHITINSGNIYTYYTGSYNSGIGNGYCYDEVNKPIKTEGTITLNGGNIHTNVLGSNMRDSSQVVLEGNGNAIVYTESDMGNLNSEKFNGIVFDEEGKSGVVKGNATLNQDLEIPTGTELTIEDGASLTIPEEVTVTNKGTITNNGSIKNTGTIKNEEGNIDNTNGTIESTSNISGVDENEIKPILYNIFMTVGAGGKASSNPYPQINHGQDIIIKISPNYGYKIKSVIVNGKDKTNDIINGKLTLEHIIQDTNIEVLFEKLPSSSNTQPEKTDNIENSSEIEQPNSNSEPNYDEI